MAAPCVQLILFTTVVYFVKADLYSEDLVLTPLENGLVYSYFKHNIIWPLDPGDNEAFHHYQLFPRKLGEVLAEYSVQELHLSLTQGVWKYRRWGLPFDDAAPGAELWVWFGEETDNISAKWKGLVNALSGMLCASLNFIDDRTSVQPRYSFRPEGLASKIQARNSSFVRYAALPNERMCTENLTPWKKLLPCGVKAGLASLMKARSLSDSHYLSMGIHVRPVCKDAGCTSANGIGCCTAVDALELRQTLGAVLEPALNPSRRTHDWSLHSLFGRAPGAVCAVAQSSRVLLDVSMNHNVESERFTLQPEAAEWLDLNGRRFAVFEAAEGLSISLKYKQPVTYGPVEASPIWAHRIVTGFGQESGGIRCQLHNSLSVPVPVVYMEVIPWFLRLYYHTLKIENNGTATTADAIHYIPGRDRERPHHLEVSFKIPAESSVSLSIEFDRLLLKWTEYPPDANHGFYIPSAVVSALLPKCALSTTAGCGHSAREPTTNGTQFVRLRTESLLLSLPTPDFSMPYNVICLTCTVIAIAFGSLHNLTTKQFVARPRTAKGRLHDLKNYIRRILGRKQLASDSACANDSSRTPEASAPITMTETRCAGGETKSDATVGLLEAGDK